MKTYYVLNRDDSKQFNDLSEALFYLKMSRNAELLIEVIEKYYTISGKVFKNIDDKIVTLNERMVKYL